MARPAFSTVADAGEQLPVPPDSFTVHSVICPAVIFTFPAGVPVNCGATVTLSLSVFSLP